MTNEVLTSSNSVAKTTGPHGRMTPDLYGEYFVQFLVSTLLEAVMGTNSSIEAVSQRPRT